MVNRFHSIEFALWQEDRDKINKSLLKISGLWSFFFTQLCVWAAGPTNRGTGCLSSLGSVNILNTNKFLCSDRGETHTIGAAALSLHLSLWCPSERADNGGSLHPRSFNWRVDVTGHWYLAVVYSGLNLIRRIIMWWNHWRAGSQLYSTNVGRMGRCSY